MVQDLAVEGLTATSGMDLFEFIESVQFAGRDPTWNDWLMTELRANDVKVSWPSRVVHARMHTSRVVYSS